MQPPAEPPRLTVVERPAPRLAQASVKPPKPTRIEVPPLSAAQLESLAAAAHDFTVIEADGRFRAVRGDAARLTELAKFGSQLCDWIGSSIGAGRCLAFEVAFTEHSLLIAENGRSTLGLTMARGGELERLKAQLRI